MNELRRGKTSLAYDESEIYLLAKLLLLLKMTAKLTQLLPPEKGTNDYGLGRLRGKKFVSKTKILLAEEKIFVSKFLVN